MFDFLLTIFNFITLEFFFDVLIKFRVRKKFPLNVFNLNSNESAMVKGEGFEVPLTRSGKVRAEVQTERREDYLF